MNEEPPQDPREKAEAFAAALQTEPDSEEADPDASESPRGVVDAKAVRSVFFVVFSVGLFVTAAVCVLAVWDCSSTVLAQRVVATYAILTISLGLFTLANEALAGKVTL